MEAEYIAELEELVNTYDAILLLQDAGRKPMDDGLRKMFRDAREQYRPSLRRAITECLCRKAK